MNNLLEAASALKFRDSQQVSSDLLGLWRQTVWGTEKTLYKIPDEETFRHLIHQGRYGELRENGRFLGGLFTLQKTLEVEQIPFQACYQGLVAIDHQVQGFGYGRKLMEQTNDFLLKENHSPSLLYAYIETDNIRSRCLFQSLDYQEIGQFFVGAFSRFRPKDSPNVKSSKRKREK